MPVFPEEMRSRAARMRAGTSVSLGGSGTEWARVRDLPGLEVPQECAEAEDYWLVVDS